MVATGNRVGGGQFAKPILSTEQKTQLMESQIKWERWIMAGLGAIAVSGVIAPIVAPQYMAKWVRLATIGGGGAAAIGLALAAQRNINKEGIYQGFEKRKLQSFLDGEADQMTIEDMQKKMQLRARLTAYIITTFPMESWIPLLASQGLKEFIPLAQKKISELNPQPVAVAPSNTVALPVNGQYSGAQQQQDWEAAAIESNLPAIRDCAKDIATLDGHVALVSKTRSGKTSLMIACILYALQLGHEVYLIDGKGDDRLRSIKGIQYYQCNVPDKVDGAFRMVDHILNCLEYRQNPNSLEDILKRDPNFKDSGRPISFFDDENNLIRDSVVDSRNTKKEGNERVDQWDRKLKRIVLQGAAAKIFFRGSAHTSRVEDWGWNTGVLDSLSFAALARLGSYESIEDLIKHQIQGKAADDAKEILNILRDIDVKEPVILSTIKPQGFYRLPLYEVPDQSASEPVTQVDWNAKAAEGGSDRTPQKSTKKPKKGSWDEQLQELKAWVTSLPGVPSDEEIAIKFNEVTGQPCPEGKGLQYLKGLLGLGGLT